MFAGSWFILDPILDANPYQTRQQSPGQYCDFRQQRLRHQLCKLPLSMLDTQIGTDSTDNSHHHSAGGLSEFLPVTLQRGIAVTAILRLFAKAGIKLAYPPRSTPSIPSFDHSTPSAGGGTVAQVFADVAKLVANASAVSQGDHCDFRILAGYTLNIGTGSGETLTLTLRNFEYLEIGGHNIYAFFFTTLADICSTQASSISPTAAGTTTGDLAKRGLKPTTQCLWREATSTFIEEWDAEFEHAYTSVISKMRIREFSTFGETVGNRLGCFHTGTQPVYNFPVATVKVWSRPMAKIDYFCLDLIHGTHCEHLPYNSHRIVLLTARSSNT